MQRSVGPEIRPCRRRSPGGRDDEALLAPRHRLPDLPRPLRDSQQSGGKAGDHSGCRPGSKFYYILF